MTPKQSKNIQVWGKEKTKDQIVPISRGHVYLRWVDIATGTLRGGGGGGGGSSEEVVGVPLEGHSGGAFWAKPLLAKPPFGFPRKNGPIGKIPEKNRETP